MNASQVKLLGAYRLGRQTGDAVASVDWQIPAPLQATLSRFMGPVTFERGAEIEIDAPFAGPAGKLPIVVLYGGGTGPNTIDDAAAGYAGEIPTGMLPVGEAGGGSIICLASSGGVYYWDHESRRGDPPHLIRRSFSEFLSDLQPEEDTPMDFSVVSSSLPD